MNIKGELVFDIFPKMTWLAEWFNRFIIFAISVDGKLLFCCPYMFVLIGWWFKSSGDLSTS